jgi:hypothetical protein
MLAVALLGLGLGFRDKLADWAVPILLLAAVVAFTAWIRL